eukprot:gene27797-49499_t
MPGRLVLPASTPGLPPLLTLGYDTQAALADDPDQSAIRDITLSLDVAQVHRTEQPFARLRDVAAALCQAMDGVLCDQNGTPLPAMAMDPIAGDLELLYDQLDGRDLSAGSLSNVNSVPTQQESTKRWWHLLFPPVVETHEGLFRPSNLALDLAVPAVCGVLVLVLFVWSQSQGKANYVALFLTLVCIWGTARSWLEWKKFGAMGRPLVRINETTIFLALPENLTQRQVELQLVDIKALVIQGEASQRTFVFERHEG